MNRMLNIFIVLFIFICSFIMFTFLSGCGGRSSNSSRVRCYSGGSIVLDKYTSNDGVQNGRYFVEENTNDHFSLINMSCVVEGNKF